MIRRCSLKNIKPGMVTGRPVFSGTGATLIPAGTTINDVHIRNITARGISEIWIVDKRMEGIEIEEALSDATKIKILQTIRSIIQDAQKASDTTQVKVPEMVVISLAGEMIDELRRDKERIVSLLEATSPENMLPIHIVNSAILSVLTGIEIGFNDKQLLELGVGALLFDLGMALVESVPEVSGELSKDEIITVRKHTEEGFKVLQRSGMITASSRAMALQHHERFDGNGYPKGLDGEKIHIFARIVAVADAYDALTAPRPHRKKYLPHEAYEFVITSGGFDFDHTVVKAFARCVAPYSVGTMVELSTGEKGVVFGVVKGQTSRPSVRILYDADGNEVSPAHDINLAENPSVMIVNIADA